MQGVERSFGSGQTLVRVLRGIDLTVQAGEIVALYGPSGSGKTTLLNLIGALDRPTAGTISVGGADILKMSEGARAKLRRKQFGFIFQSYTLVPTYTALENIDLALRLPGLGFFTRRDRAKNALAAVGLTAWADHAPDELSGGQRQRVAIARALAVEPKVILADEPVSMLDVSIRMGILNLMARLRDEQNIAFLYVTHDVASARYFADETLVMYAGRIVEGADSVSLSYYPLHPYTQLLLASVPDPARDLRTETIDDKGEVPDLGTVGHGCPFAARCPHVMPQCREAMPPVTVMGGSRWVRCYLYEDEAIKRATERQMLEAAAVN